MPSIYLIGFLQTKLVIYADLHVAPFETRNWVTISTSFAGLVKMRVKIGLIGMCQFHIWVVTPNI